MFQGKSSRMQAADVPSLYNDQVKKAHLLRTILIAPLGRTAFFVLYMLAHVYVFAALTWALNQRMQDALSKEGLRQALINLAIPYLLFLIWIHARRLHDLANSRLIAIASIIPGFNLVLFIYLILRPGQSENNPE